MITQKTAGRITGVLILSTGLLFGAVPQAQAQLADVYIGVDVSELEFKADGFSSAEPRAVAFNVGSRLTRHFGVEARIATSLSDADTRVGLTPVNMEVNNYYGFYGTGILPLTNMLNLYGILGYTYSDMKLQSATFSQNATDNGFAYGLGASLDISYSTSVRLEWAKLMDGSNYTLDALTLGLRFRF